MVLLGSAAAVGGHCSGGEQASASQGCWQSAPCRPANGSRPSANGGGGGAARRSPDGRMRAIRARRAVRLSPRTASVFGNRERLLPAQTTRLLPRIHRADAGRARPGRPPDRLRRAVRATPPEACYYTADHYASFHTDHAMSALAEFFHDTGGTRHALADSPSEHRAVDPRLPRRRSDAGGAHTPTSTSCTPT